MLRHISLDQLRYFVALADELHFTKAAQKCNVSQPPFSRSILKLEATLNASLVIRNTRNVELTAAGLLFSTQARQALSLLNSAVVDIAHSKKTFSRLRLGVIEYAFTVFGADFIERFMMTHPNISLELADDPPENLTFPLTQGRVDLQFAAFTDKDVLPAKLGLKEIVIVREPLAVLVGVKSALANKTEVGVKDLSQESLVVFDRSRAPDVYRVFTQSFVDHGVEAKIELEVGFFQTMLATVKATQRVGLVPLSARKLIDAEVRVIPLRASEMPQIRLSLVWSGSRESADFLSFVYWVRNRARWHYR